MSKFFLKNNLIKKDKISIVPGSGVDVTGFNKCTKQDNGKLSFLLIARLLKDKGLYEYIEAAKSMLQETDKVEFLLAGQFDDGNPSAVQKETIRKFVKFVIE